MDPRIYVFLDKAGKLASHDVCHPTNPGAFFKADPDTLKELPELCALVCRTESMDANEKQYWFDILPSMTAEQVDRLFTILETERAKLAELEKKYQEEIRSLNAAHLVEWAAFQNGVVKEAAAQLGQANPQ